MVPGRQHFTWLHRKHGLTVLDGSLQISASDLSVGLKLIVFAVLSKEILKNAFQNALCTDRTKLIHP